MKITRLIDGPIISPSSHPSIGENIQGPSLIRVPDWIESPLGRYYLYFADHKGSYIRLAYANELSGPWKIYTPGSLHLSESYFPTEAPEVPPGAIEAIRKTAKKEHFDLDTLLHDPITELTTPHIASPDVIVDEERKRLTMYFHGLEGFARQVSRVATSSDGIHFEALPEIVGTHIKGGMGKTYLRAFSHSGKTYAMAMPGQFYRSEDGLTDWEVGPRLFEPNMRHSALLLKGRCLHVFWTRVGDAPERILHSTLDLSLDWMNWKESAAIEVLRPERDWEGAKAPLTPSVRSVAYGAVNQLRDPAIYVEANRTYLLYAVAGESGIAIAEIDFEIQGSPV